MPQQFVRRFRAWRLSRGVTNASEEALDRSISLCERWEWAGGGLVIAGVAVTILIAAKHPKYDSFLEQWGSAAADTFVAIGVAIEIIFGRMAGLRHDELRRRSDRASAEANRRAAEANQKAEEARLALEAFKAPRQLSDAPAFVTLMNQFAGISFATASAGGEALAFAVEIADSLVLAGLNWLNWPFGGAVINPPNERPQIGLDMMQGMETHLFDTALTHLGGCLHDALAQQGHRCEWIIKTPVHSGLQYTFILIVGSKVR